MDFNYYHEILKEFSNEECSCIDKYEYVEVMRSGKFGTTRKAVNKENPGKYLVIRNIEMTSKRFKKDPFHTLEELKILKAVNHTNIAKLVDLCAGPPSFGYVHHSYYFVYEHCGHDLQTILNNSKLVWSFGEMKNLVRQMLVGLNHIHNVVHNYHGNLKPTSIFINHDGIVKIGDFRLEDAVGEITENENLPKDNYSMWYLSPELLLDGYKYGNAVDMWAAGCIIAQIFTKNVLLQGNDINDQLDHIINLCGSMTVEVWPGFQRLPGFYSRPLRSNIERSVLVGPLKNQITCPLALDLLDKLFVYDPSKRSEAALTISKHRFFMAEPQPEDLQGLITAHANSTIQSGFAGRCFEQNQLEYMNYRENQYMLQV